MPKRLLLIFAMISILLAGCGSSPQEDFERRVGQAMKVPASNPTATSPMGSLRRVAMSAANTNDPTSITPDQLFDWAEATYPQFFPSREKTLTWSVYQFRYYKDTDVYLAVENGAKVVALGKPTNGALIELGSLIDYRCKVSLPNCKVPIESPIYSQQIPALDITTIKEEFALIDLGSAWALYLGRSGGINDPEISTDPKSQIWVWTGSLWKETLDQASKVQGWVNNIIISDFNGDQRLDIALIDHGREVRVSPEIGGGFPGHGLDLLVQGPNLTWTSRPITEFPAFYHASSGSVDITGDGLPDIAVGVLGLGGRISWAVNNRGLDPSHLTGVALFQSDPSGNWREVSKDYLPREFTNQGVTYDKATNTWLNITRPTWYSGYGSASLIKQPQGVDLIVTSEREIVILRQSQAGEKFQVTQRIIYALTDQRIGSTQLADWNQDGTTDILLNVETENTQTDKQISTKVIILTYHQGQYIDRTLQLLGSNTITRNWQAKPMSGASKDTFQLIDITGDGRPDLVWAMSWGTIDQYKSGIRIWKDGAYSSVQGQELAWMDLPRDWVFRPALGDLNRDGRTDLVIIRDLDSKTSEIVWKYQ